MAMHGTASFSLKRGSCVAQVACTGYLPAQSVQLSVTDSIRERVQPGQLGQSRPVFRALCARCRRMRNRAQGRQNEHSGWQLGRDRDKGWPAARRRAAADRWWVRDRNPE